MLKMIIVDDEYIICEGLKTLINWESIGIEVIGTADNGAAALELALKQKPDLILSDISMPHFNGLQLIETLRRNGMNTEVIFISAYSRFEYAKEALRHGAFDYILKPIQETQLFETVTRCAEKIRSRAKASPHSLPESSRNDALKSLLLGNEKTDLEAATISEFEPDDASHVMAIGIWDDGASSFTSRIEEHAFKALRITPVQMRKDWRVLLLFSTPEALFPVPSLLEDLLKDCPPSASVSSSDILPLASAPGPLLAQITMGHITAGVTGLPFVSFEAQTRRLSEAFPSFQDGCALLLTLVKTVQKGELTFALHRFFLTMFSNNLFLDIDLVRLQCIELINHILRDPSVSHLQDYLSTPDKTLTAQKSITRCTSIEEVFSATKNLLVNLSMCIEEAQSNSTKRLVALTIQFIEKNYRRDISLSEVAQALYISPAYLSKIFSNEMNETFSHHLQNFRIEAAKQLLRTTHFKIYEIADQVGYSDVAHFSKSFKQATGLSPYQYRNH